MDFSTSFTVDQSPDQVYAAINDVRGWWSGDIDGVCDVVGAQFTYRCQDLHRSTQQITELVPGQRIVWRVLDSYIDFVADRTEWTGTHVIFEIAARDGRTEVRFSHVGLRPDVECYRECSSAWSCHVNGNLRDLIVAGVGVPNAGVRR